MTSSDPNDFQRQWMYNGIDRETRCMTEEFQMGLEDFMRFATQHVYEEKQNIMSVQKCQSRHLVDVNRVCKHL